MGYNLLEHHGSMFSAKYFGVKITGKITVENERVYLCQDEVDGADCEDKQGYKYSWWIGSFPEKWDDEDFTDFKLIDRLPRFKVGDEITYKARKDLPDQRYQFGGEDHGGFLGRIQSYIEYVPEKDCYKIDVEARASSSYSMLESEFLEYDEVVKCKDSIKIEYAEQGPALPKKFYLRHTPEIIDKLCQLFPELAQNLREEYNANGANPKFPFILVNKWRGFTQSENFAIEQGYKLITVTDLGIVEETKAPESIEYKHGQSFTAMIDSIPVKGKISINSSGVVFLCQDEQSGCNTDNKLGYKYSWTIGDGTKESLHRANISNLLLEDIPSKCSVYYKNEDEECNCTLVHSGTYFSANIGGSPVTGQVYDIDGKVYLCQDKFDLATKAPVESNYKYAWSNYKECYEEITKFKVLDHLPKVDLTPDILDYSIASTIGLSTFKPEFVQQPSVAQTLIADWDAVKFVSTEVYVVSSEQPEVDLKEGSDVDTMSQITKQKNKISKLFNI